MGKSKNKRVVLRIEGETDMPVAWLRKKEMLTVRVNVSESSFYSTNIKILQVQANLIRDKR